MLEMTTNTTNLVFLKYLYIFIYIYIYFFITFAGGAVQYFKWQDHELTVFKKNKNILDLLEELSDTSNGNQHHGWNETPDFDSPSTVWKTQYVTGWKVGVISRVHCARCCAHILLILLFLYCAFQVQVICKRLINILFYITMNASHDQHEEQTLCTRSSWLIQNGENVFFFFPFLFSLSCDLESKS